MYSILYMKATRASPTASWSAPPRSCWPYEQHDIYIYIYVHIYIYIYLFIYLFNQTTGTRITKDSGGDSGRPPEQTPGNRVWKTLWVTTKNEQLPNHRHQNLKASRGHSQKHGSSCFSTERYLYNFSGLEVRVISKLFTFAWWSRPFRPFSVSNNKTIISASKYTSISLLLWLLLLLLVWLLWWLLLLLLLLVVVVVVAVVVLRVRRTSPLSPLWHCALFYHVSRFPLCRFSHNTVWKLCLAFQGPR